MEVGALRLLLIILRNLSQRQPKANIDTDTVRHESRAR
jgi:hypothetical protein